MADDRIPTCPDEGMVEVATAFPVQSGFRANCTIHGDLGGGSMQEALAAVRAHALNGTVRGNGP